MATKHTTNEVGQCVICGKSYTKRKPHQKMCSSECRRKHVYPSQCKARDLGLTAGTIGAISELMVSAKLMSQGYHVFRALSPCCPFDIVAVKGDEVRRIEVRTGRRNKQGTIATTKSHHEMATEIAVFIPEENEVLILVTPVA